MDTSTGTGYSIVIGSQDPTALAGPQDQGVQTMTATQIELYNYPTYAASAEPCESGVRVVVAYNTAPVANNWSISKDVTWSSYNEDGMTAVTHMAYALAKKLADDMFGEQD